jgi:hypothetical protein
MFGRLGDLGRLSWGLLYWNGRKALFRARGASGPAPCQHPSDTGRAHVTGCEACAGWRDPAMFRRMCPLLETIDGRRVCSVDARGVRPFWGRAFLIYGAFVCALAAAAVLSVFSAFRVIGYRVPLYVVAWPPAWHRIEKARADYFYRLALRSLSAGDVRQCYLALGQVHALDPSNTVAARLLAQFTEITNPEYSDSIYSQLVGAGGAEAESAAEVWVHALLSRGDFPALAALSSRMLQAGAGHVPAWTQGLLFAQRMGAGAAEADRLLVSGVRLPAEARSALSLARSLRTGTDDERFKVIQLYLRGATTSFEVYNPLRCAIDLGRAQDVLAFLESQQGAALNPYDREALKLDAYSALGWHEPERREIGSILDQGVSAATVTLAACHLVRYPDGQSAARLFELLAARPLEATAENAGTHVALLCAAGVNGLGASMAGEAELLGRIVGGTCPAWDSVKAFFQNKAASKNPAQILPALGQLPLEMVYALNAHYRAPPPAGG